MLIINSILTKGPVVYVKFSQRYLCNTDEEYDENEYNYCSDHVRLLIFLFVFWLYYYKIFLNYWR